MAVVRYLVDESSVSITADGPEVTDAYLVTGVEGPPGLRPYLATQQPEIPRYGQRHGVKGISADSINCRALDVDQFRVTVVNRRPTLDTAQTGNEDEIDEQDFGSLEFFYVQRDVPTEIDAQGKQITVTHTFADTDEHKRGGMQVTQGGSVNAQVWQQGIRYTRRESKPPSQLQNIYAGRINDDPWNGYSAKTVLCAGIDGNTADGGQTWTVNYVFMLDPRRNWKADVLFADPEDGGRAPPGVKEGVGYKSVDIYPTIVFDTLNIDFTRLRRSAGLVGKSPIGYPVRL